MTSLRRLAAILAADVAGYSRLIGRDEEGTLAGLRAARQEVVEPRVVQYRGRVVKTTGDGALIEFASVVDALRCAAAVQRDMARRMKRYRPNSGSSFVSGIHQGDIVVEEGDIFGDGVNVFDLQDQIATSVAGVIEPALQAAEVRRSAERPTTELSAYDLYLRALSAFFSVTQERTVQALALFDRAIAIDPNYWPALTWAAVCHWQCVTDGWAVDPEAQRQKAIVLARRALEVSQHDDPGVLANASFILANFGEDIGAMTGLIDRALALNPSFARGWNLSGLLHLYAGDLDHAIEHVETAMRLSPRERIGAPLVIIALAYFFQRRFDEALANLLLAVQEDPGSPAIYRILAACYAHLGRLTEAQDCIEQLRGITSLVMPRVLPWRRAEDRELLLSGLRIATGEAQDVGNNRH